MPDLISFVGEGVIPIFLIIVIAVLIVAYIGSRYKVAGANEALIVAGQRDRATEGRRELKVVRGGGVIVFPLVNKVGRLKLTARQINVNLSDAVTRQGIKVAVQGVATFKIGADDESIRNVIRSVPCTVFSFRNVGPSIRTSAGLESCWPSLRSTWMTSEVLPAGPAQVFTALPWSRSPPAEPALWPLPPPAAGLPAVSVILPSLQPDGPD